jgi:hypothetical protein
MTDVPVGRVLLVFTCLFLATPMFAESQARIVRLSDVQGNVQIDRRTGDGFESALQNLPITQGMRIWTKEDGRVEIEFEDGSTVRLAPNTSLEFARLSLHDSGGKNTELELSEGTAYCNIDLGKRDDFVVNLGHRSINLERSARFRASMDQSQAHIAVHHGQVEVLGAGSETVTISKNRTVSFDLFDQDNYTEARSYEDGPYEDWNDELDQYHERNFNRARNDSPYASGFSDLNYYGSYISDPGLGSCWRPYFASYGWDPFADGTWVWYPGFGYTWVSSYPWGWAPYRYGTWNYLQASGWCWQPGGWNQWVVAPRFVRTPVGWKPPVPPVNGRGRVPRLRGNPAEGGPASRFGDPTRRVVREGADGGILRNQAPGEAGLGVPRGRLNLGTLGTTPERGSSGLGDEGTGRGDRVMRGSGSGPAPSAGTPPGRPAGPRVVAPPPAPRTAPPPAPRSAPPTRPHPSRRG